VFDVKQGDFNLAKEFQTYGLEWTDTTLIFYFNGRELRREKNTFCDHPAPVWLSLAVIPWAGTITDAIDGTRMEVDYVRVYRRK
jgi:beta-glucanase (GH16 family)